MSGSFYFSNFRNVSFSGVELKNIFDRIRIKEAFKSSENIFRTIKILDNITPEDVAFQIYNDKAMFWVVLVANSSQDYFYDWPLTDRELRALATKYYEDGHHVTGESVDAIYLKLFAENDAKRSNVKVIKPELILDFLAAARSLKGGAV